MTELPPPVDRPIGWGVHIALVVVVVIAGMAPVAYYRATWAGAPLIKPQAAYAELAAGGPVALVDIAEPAAFDERHLDGAFNWPASSIARATGPADAPAELRDRKLLLLCRSGFRSAAAVRQLQHVGFNNVFSVRGGLQDWIGRSHAPTSQPFGQFRLHDGRTAPLPSLQLSRLEQFLAVFCGFVVKTIYGLLAFVLVVVLWRSRSADLAAIRWAMIAFFVGENCCAANYLLFSEDSLLMEYLHSVGMLFSFALATYAILDGFDRRVLQLSDPARRCAALPLCGRCIKHEPVPCGLRRTFLMLLAALAIMALMPLNAQFMLDSYTVKVFSTATSYSQRAAYQAFELRYCPWLAAGFFAASLAVLWVRPGSLALPKVLLAAGAGPFGFGLLRMILNLVYRDNLVYSIVWEETTEFLFVAGVMVVLWIFRHRLWPAHGHAETAAESR